MTASEAFIQKMAEIDRAYNSPEYDEWKKELAEIEKEFGGSFEHNTSNEHREVKEEMLCEEILKGNFRAVFDYLEDKQPDRSDYWGFYRFCRKVLDRRGMYFMQSKLGELNEIYKEYVAKVDDKEDDEPESASLSDIPGIDAVFLSYPEFANDFPLLLKHGYIQKENGRLIWDKTQKSCAEYFGNQPRNGANIEWRLVEKLFGRRDLKNSFSTNGSSYDRKKSSKDYEKWLEIKNTPTGV